MPLAVAIGALCIALITGLLASPTMAQPGSPHVIATPESAIAIGKDICGLNHQFQNWNAVAVGDNWQVKASKPLRFVAMAECHVTVPIDGSTPFNQSYLAAPNVPAGCSASANRVCF
jgi:hypothetical protein